MKLRIQHRKDARSAGRRQEEKRRKKNAARFRRRIKSKAPIKKTGAKPVFSAVLQIILQQERQRLVPMLEQQLPWLSLLSWLS
jgi:hypothetical protein